MSISTSRGGRVQPSSAHQERQDDPETGESLPGSEATATTGSESTGRDESTDRRLFLPVPTDVLRLDYDRELGYLEQEGRLRGGLHPTGFRQ